MVKLVENNKNSDKVPTKGLPPRMRGKALEFLLTLPIVETNARLVSLAMELLNPTRSWGCFFAECFFKPTRAMDFYSDEFKTLYGKKLMHSNLNNYMEVINRLAGTELIKKVKWKLGPFGKPCVYYYVDLTVKPFLHKENNFVYRYFVCSNLHNEYEDKIKLFLNKYSEENRQLFGYQLRLSFDIAAKRHFSRKVVNKLLSSKTKLDEAKLFWVPTKKKESENGKTEPILRNDVERIHSRFTDLLSSPEEFVSKKSKDTHWKIYYYVFYPFLKTILNEKSSHFKFKYLMGFKFEELGFSSFEKQKQEFLNLFNAPYNSAIKRIRRSSIHTSLDSKTGELKYRVDKKRLYNSMILNKH